MDSPTKLDVLAIAAHPDDIEITCGGLLIKMAKQGRAVGALDITQGEMGTYGDEADRAQEARKAAKVLGLKYRRQLDMPDSAVDYSYENKVKIAQVIRDTKPEMVILPHWEQRHPDHLACSRLGYDACFLAGLKKANLDNEPFRPHKIAYVSYFRNTDYSFLVDISEEMEQKMEAVAAYRSQFADEDKKVVQQKMAQDWSGDNWARGDKASNIFHPGVNVFELMQTRARQLGMLVNVQYAEAYTLREHVLIDDPQKMPVRSI